MRVLTEAELAAEGERIGRALAPGSVVHLQGGVIAFWFAKMIGPRVGKYNKDGSVNAIPGHNMGLAAIGCFVRVRLRHSYALKFDAPPVSLRRSRKASRSA